MVLWIHQSTRHPERKMKTVAKGVESGLERTFSRRRKQRTQKGMRDERNCSGAREKSVCGREDEGVNAD